MVIEDTGGETSAGDKGGETSGDKVGETSGDNSGKTCGVRTVEEVVVGSSMFAVDASEEDSRAY